MAGLSSDPAKKKRQLEALAKGRRVLAERTLGDDAPPKAAPAAPGGVAEHSYPDPAPEPPEPREPATPPARPAEPEPRRGRGFLDGLRAGLLD